MIYTMVKAKNGRELYYKDEGKGKSLISVKTIPIGVLSQLKPGVEVSDEVPEELPQKSCFVCDKPAEHYRMAGLQLVDLCRRHYYGMTMGKLIQKVRESNHEEVRQEEENEGQDQAQG